MTSVELRTVQARGTVALAGRETRRVVTLWTQTILPPVMTALLFLAVFGGALGSRIREVEGIPYLDFVLPGLLVMTVAAQSFSNNSTSLYQAKSEGYVEDVLTSPLRGWQIALSYLAGGLVRAFLASGVVVLAALPFVGPVERPALALVSVGLAALVFASLGVITGVWAETFDQHSFIANLVIAPLALVGGVFYSVDELDEPWATLTRFDPLYYLVDATRAGFTGVHDTAVALSLAVTGAVALATFVLASLLIARGWRLKP